MVITEHTESYCITLSKNQLAMCVKQQWPFLGTFLLDDADINNSSPGEYVRLFFAKNLPNP